MTAPLTAQCADCKHRDDPEYGCKLSSLRNCVRYEKEQGKGKPMEGDGVLI